MNIIPTQTDSDKQYTFIDHIVVEDHVYFQKTPTDIPGLSCKYGFIEEKLNNEQLPFYPCNANSGYVNEENVSEFSKDNQEILEKHLLDLINKKPKIIILEIGISTDIENSSTSVFLKNKRESDIYIGVDVKDMSFMNDTDKNIHTIMNNAENIDNVIEYLLGINVNNIDVLMIDGYHSINQIYKEWEYTKYLNNNGIVILHDTNAHPGPYFLTKSINTNLYDVYKYCNDVVDYGIVIAVKKIHLCEVIITQGQSNFIVNETNMHRYENVKRYKHFDCKAKLTVEYITPLTISMNQVEKNYYFVFNCPGDDALGHWIYESFIFYSLYTELKQHYPTMKILTSNRKKYVKSMLRFFDLDDNVEYEIDTTKDNTCFFPPIVSISTTNALECEDIYRRHLRIYIDSVQSKLIEFPKKNKYLFLPRNTVDNFVNNDRVIPHVNLISEQIIEMGGVVLNTYDFNNIYLQFNIINNSDVIILDCGSSVIFNTIFLKGKKIFILCYYGVDYYINYINNTYPGKIILFENIRNNNEVHYIEINSPYFTFEDIKKHL